MIRSNFGHAANGLDPDESGWANKWRISLAPWQQDPPGGFVAVTWKGHNEPTRELSSGGETKELVDQTDFARRALLLQDTVPTTDHPHHLETLDCRTRRFHALESACWPDHTLESAVIRLNNVVGIF
jgi:hypothetical protein